MGSWELVVSSQKLGARSKACLRRFSCSQGRQEETSTSCRHATDGLSQGGQAVERLVHRRVLAGAGSRSRGAAGSMTKGSSNARSASLTSLGWSRSIRNPPLILCNFTSFDGQAPGEALNKVAQASCLSRLMGFQPVDSDAGHLVQRFLKVPLAPRCPKIPDFYGVSVTSKTRSGIDSAVGRGAFVRTAGDSYWIFGSLVGASGARAQPPLKRRRHPALPASGRPRWIGWPLHPQGRSHLPDRSHLPPGDASAAPHLPAPMHLSSPFQSVLEKSVTPAFSNNPRPFVAPPLPLKLQASSLKPQASSLKPQASGPRPSKTQLHYSIACGSS